MKKIFITIVSLLLLEALWCLIVRPIFDNIPPINESTKTCLVTGSSSGIGLEIVRTMVKRGWTVIGIARRKDVLERINQELGDMFIAYVCDVGKTEQVHTACQNIKARGLKPTLFFLSAGIGDIEQPFNPLLDIHRNTFATNYFGVINWVDEWLPAVKIFGGGTFVVVSSLAAIFSSPEAAGYGASKAAINACFQALRLQYRDDNIGFVTILPGPVQTEMLKVKKELPFTHSPEEEAAYIVEQVFKQKNQIEPSWFYSCLMRFLQWLPDAISMKMIK